MPKQNIFEVPAALDIAKIHVLIDEIRELNYRKFRPFMVVGAGVLSDKLVLALGSDKGLTFEIRAACYKELILILLDSDSQQVARRVFSGNYSRPDLARFEQINATIIPQLKIYLDYLFVACVQTPILPAIYFSSKKITKAAINYFGLQKALPDKSNFKEGDSGTNKAIIESLSATRNSLRTASDGIAKYCFIAFLALLLLSRFGIGYGLNDRDESRSNYGVIWLLVFSLYAKLEGYLTRRSLNYIETDLTVFLGQLNQITKMFDLSWCAEKGGYLKSSYFTLDVSKRSLINYTGQMVEKNIFLEILKKVVVKHQGAVICFNSFRGIIFTREKVFNKEELKEVNEDFRKSLDEAVIAQRSMTILLAQLNEVSKLFPYSYQWDFSRKEQFFFLNLSNTEKAEVALTVSSFVELLGEGRVKFREDSCHLIVVGSSPIEKAVLNAVFNKVKKNILLLSKVEYLADSKDEDKFDVVRKAKVKSRPLHLPVAKSNEQQILPINESKTSALPCDQLYPIYSPNLPNGSHFSRYSVPNQRIMTTKVTRSEIKGDTKSDARTLYDRFFDVVKNGQMNGSGNHIARLKKPKKITGLFGNTIFSTHKLIIPSEDVRIYGEKVENVIEFNTVVPTHKWANRY